MGLRFCVEFLLSSFLRIFRLHPPDGRRSPAASARLARPGRKPKKWIKSRRFAAALQTKRSCFAAVCTCLLQTVADEHRNKRRMHFAPLLLLLLGAARAGCVSRSVDGYLLDLNGLVLWPELTPEDSGSLAKLRGDETFYPFAVSPQSLDSPRLVPRYTTAEQRKALATANRLLCSLFALVRVPTAWSGDYRNGLSAKLAERLDLGRDLWNT